ncbi:MAG: hypothetical protein JW765_05365 [Deltaproteobacteria bacterium]|nr:hypothetical protein [Candidatus Zymogenaceae bacterium]
MSNKNSNPFHDEDDDKDQNVMNIFGQFGRKPNTPGGLDETRKNLGKMIGVSIGMVALVVFWILLFMLLKFFFGVVF